MNMIKNGTLLTQKRGAYKNRIVCQSSSSLLSGLDPIKDEQKIYEMLIEHKNGRALPEKKRKLTEKNTSESVSDNIIFQYYELL